MNEIAGELGAMDPADLKRASLLKELENVAATPDLHPLRTNELIAQRMDALAGEMATLKPGESHRPEIVDEIMRLNIC